MKEKENLLDFVGYHEKWHASVQSHRKEYRYNQNDHLISEIFKRLNISDGFFVEFGAWDGIKGSNTRKLFESGWSGILIEPEEERYNDLEKNYLLHDNVITINSFVEDTGPNRFDNVVDPYVDRGIDFCSIDIDGLDVDVFEAIEKHLPTVICIEGGQMLNPFYTERLPRHISEANIQQGIHIMNESFEKKGYKLLCTYQDSFFIKKEYYHLFNVKGDLMNLYLDGILAYPRIPWILKKLSQVGLQNEILNIISNSVPFCNPDSSTNFKMSWIDQNYETISRTIEKIRSTYNQKFGNLDT